MSAMLAAGCGDDDGAEPAAAKSGTPTTAISVEEAARSPESITCADIQTQSEEAGKAALAAANALAGTVQLRDANPYQTAQRLLFAIYDLCERVDDGSYLPAADAVEAVKSGRYQLGGLTSVAPRRIREPRLRLGAAHRRTWSTAERCASPSARIAHAGATVAVAINQHEGGRSMTVDRGALVTANGSYVCAEGGGGRELVANRPAQGPWETLRFAWLSPSDLADRGTVA